MTDASRLNVDICFRHNAPDCAECKPRDPDSRTNGCDHAAGDACYRCCRLCDTDQHVCPGCGSAVAHGTVACVPCSARVAAEIEPVAAPVPQTSPLAAPAPVAVDLDDKAAAWYKALVEADDQIAMWTGIRGRAIEQIQDAIGKATEARINGRTVVTWRPSKPGKTLDRKALEAAYGADVIKGFEVDKKAARPFKRVEGGA